MKTSLGLYVIILLCFSSGVLAKNNIRKMIGKESARGSVVTSDFQKFEAKHILFYTDSLAFIDKHSGQKVSLLYANLDYVRYSHGRKMVLPAIIGGSSFALGMMLGTMNTTYYETEYYYEFDKKRMRLVEKHYPMSEVIQNTIVGGIVGTALGLGVGLFIPKMKTHSFSADKLNVSFAPSLYSNPDSQMQFFVGVKYRF